MTAPTKPASAPVHEIGYQQAVGQYMWWLYENETTPELIWPQSVYVYDQMRRTDSQVGSILRAVNLLVLRTPWRIDPNGARTEVVELVANDLGLPIVGQSPKAPPRTKDRFSWKDHLTEALLMLPLGYSYFEQVYRIDADGSRAHLRKLALRPARTIEYVNVADDGGLISIKQYWVRSGERPQPIPVDHLVAYIHAKEGGNWLGTSILRNCYKNWLLKDRLLRVQAQTIERNGMGIPLYTGPEGATDLSAGLAMAKAWRAGEAAGSAVPYGATLKLVGVEGTLPDAEPAIRYHDESIAKTVLAHFLNLGQQMGTGSYALGTTLGDFFTLGVQTVAQQIADVANSHVVEDLVDINFGEDEPAPRITFDEIGSRQAATAQALKLLIDAGVIHSDDILEESTRQQYGLPPRDPNAPPPGPLPGLTRETLTGPVPGSAPADNAQMGAQSVAAKSDPKGVAAEAADASVDEDLEAYDDDTDALLAALAAFTGEVVAAEFDPLKHPRGPGGRFRSTFDKVMHALDGWSKGNGHDDPLKDFNREQLRGVAVKRGIKLKRGESREGIRDALLADLKVKVRDQRDNPTPEPNAKFTLKGKAHRNKDVGVYQEADGKVSLYEESGSGARGARVVTVDDLAGLERWADANGEYELANWAQVEGAPAPAKAVKKAGPAQPRGSRPSEADLKAAATRVADAYTRLDERGQPVKRPGFTLNLGAFNDAEMRRLRDDEALLAKWAPDRPSIESIIDSLDKAETADAPRPASVLLAHWARSEGGTPAVPTPAKKASPAAKAAPATGHEALDSVPVKATIKPNAHMDSSSWTATGFTGLAKPDRSAVAAVTKYLRAPWFANQRLRDPSVPLHDQSFAELDGGPVDTVKAAKAAALADRHIAALDRVMAQSSLPQDIVTYRGVDLAALDGLPDSAVGHSWTDPGFVSTATSRDVAENDFAGKGKALLRITAPEGTPALGLDGLGESEVLLGRGLTYRVTADHGLTRDGAHLLDVEILPSDGPAVAAPDKPAPRKAVPKGDLTGANGLSSDPAVRDVQVENRIREAYRAAYQDAHGSTPDGYVSLAAIRDHLGESMSRADVDTALRRMAVEAGGRQDHSVRIIPIANNKGLTQAERDSALRMGGEDHHAIKIPDPSPRPLPTTDQPSKARALSPLDAAPISMLSNLERPKGAKPPTASERVAFDAYGSDGQAINARLRGGGRITAPIAQMDAAMARSPLSSDVELWRGVSGGSDLPGLDLSGDVTGSEFTDRSFVSTSVNRQVAERFAQLPGSGPKVVLRVSAPQGTGAVAFSGAGGITESQGELLLERGLTFRVTADHGTVDGLRHLDVEVIPSTKATKAAPAAKPPTASTPDATLTTLRDMPTETRRDALDLRKMDDLKAMLRESGLPVSGRKRDLVDRLVGHLDGAPTTPAKTASAKDRRVATMATRLHEDWRKTRLQGDGSFEPRIKTTKDEAWIAAHGTDQVDIANTDYADLPEDWKAENRAAAEAIDNILQRDGGKVDLGDKKVRDQVGEEIHQEWLKRNDWAKGGELDVSFVDLPKSEQDKDIDQLRVAMGGDAPGAAKKAAPTKAAPPAAPGQGLEPGYQLHVLPALHAPGRYNVKAVYPDGSEAHVIQNLSPTQARRELERLKAAGPEVVDAEYAKNSRASRERNQRLMDAEALKERRKLRRRQLQGGGLVRLREQLAARGLDTSGTTAQLINRLLDAEGTP